MILIELVAFMSMQSKTLSLNPAKNVGVLTLRRPFGSEPSDLQPMPAKAAPIVESNDVSTEVEAPATESVISHPDEVHFLCFFLHFSCKIMCQWQNFKNWSIIDKDMGKSEVPHSLAHPVQSDDDDYNNDYVNLFAN